MNNEKEITTKLSPFTFHGMPIHSEGEVVKSDCFLCGKDNHFFIKSSTGQWNCRKCQAEGNIPVFLHRLWEASDNSDEALAPLAADRSLKIETLRSWGIVKSMLTQEYLINSFNNKGAFANLTRIVKGANGKWTLYSTPTCKVHPFGSHLYRNNKNHYSGVWWMEGPWDGMSLYEVLAMLNNNGGRLIRTNNPAKSLAAREKVMAAPGAGTFSHEWLEDYGAGLLNNFFFDSDHPGTFCTKCHTRYKLSVTKVCPKCDGRGQGPVSQPGWDGENRIIKLLSTQGNPCDGVRIAQWGPNGYDPEKPSGYDFRDLRRDRQDAGAYTHATQLLRSVEIDEDEVDIGEEEEVNPLPRSTFKELCEDYKKALHFTPRMREALAVALATVVSTELPGKEQLWLRIIGPPGSGKTTIAEAVSAAKEYTFPVSIQTGFHSGYVGAKHKGKKKSASLIPQMNGKTCIIKDADTFLTAPNRDRMLSEMRDFYDGVSRARYRTGETHIHDDLRITFIICGTDELRSLNRSFLGDRFLDCEILGAEDATPYIDRASSNAYNALAAGFKKKDDQAEGGEAHGMDMLLLKGATLGLIQHFKTMIAEGAIPAPTLAPADETRLKAIGQFLSFMRARVKRDRELEGSLSYRPRAELATRLVGQMVRLGTMLAVILGKPKVDSEIVGIVNRVAMATAEGWPLEITRLLLRYQNGLSVTQIASTLGLSETSVRRQVEDMLELKILAKNSAPNNSGARGRDRHLLVVSLPIRAFYNASSPPKKTKPEA